MRARPAPSAIRVANSPARLAVRARNRFAMFAHAISRSMADAANTNTSWSLTLPAKISRIGTNSITTSVLRSGSCA
jgi:hypothetical protein